MDQADFQDAVAAATAALTVVRNLRARVETLAFQLPLGALSRTVQVLDRFDGSGGFTDAVLQHLHQTITWCETTVAAGTASR